MNRSELQELFSEFPRDLNQVEAELLFLEGGYLLHHRAPNGGDRYKFLSPATLKMAFASESIDSGWLPSHVVRWGNGKRGEWVAAFFPADLHLLDLGQGFGENACVLPGTLFLGEGINYWAWAISGETFAPDAPAFLMPLPNIDHSGKICWGEITPPPASPAAIEQAWKQFLNSPFNGDYSQGKAIGSDDCRQALAAGTVKLQPYNRTLSELIAEAIA